MHACAWPVQCMRVQGGCSACSCMASAMYTCTGWVPCMRVCNQCSARTCSVSAVHACAWTMQCLRVRGWCSARVCSVGAAHAWQGQCRACVGVADVAFMACLVPTVLQHHASPVHGVGTSAQRPGAQHTLGWGGQGLPTAPAPHSSGSALPRSEVQRAVPPRKVQEGGMLLPLRRGLRRRRVWQ